jgi:hypothetical protein
VSTAKICPLTGLWHVWQMYYRALTISYGVGLPERSSQVYLTYCITITYSGYNRAIVNRLQKTKRFLSRSRLGFSGRERLSIRLKRRWNKVDYHAFYASRRDISNFVIDQTPIIKWKSVVIRIFWVVDYLGIAKVTLASPIILTSSLV